MSERVLNNLIVIMLFMILAVLAYLGFIVPTLADTATKVAAQSVESVQTEPIKKTTNKTKVATSVSLVSGKPQATTPPVEEAAPVTALATGVATQLVPEPTPLPESKPEPVDPQAAIPVQSSTYYLQVPAVGINKPVYFDTNGVDPNQYWPVMERGIAHYAGTPHPGQAGSSLLFAHSSFWRDLPNNADEYFLPLYNAKIGDRVYVKNNTTQYTYEIYKTKVIWPTDPEFLSQEGPTRVTLLTCWPKGSTAQRLLVYAKQL